jgi:uncharacterized Zn-finger protein
LQFQFLKKQWERSSAIEDKIGLVIRLLSTLPTSVANIPSVSEPRKEVINLVSKSDFPHLNGHESEPSPMKKSQSGNFTVVSEPPTPTSNPSDKKRTSPYESTISFPKQEEIIPRTFENWKPPPELRSPPSFKTPALLSPLSTKGTLPSQGLAPPILSSSYVPPATPTFEPPKTTPGPTLRRGRRKKTSRRPGSEKIDRESIDTDEDSVKSVKLKHLCPIPGCGDSFKTKFSLKRHTKRHTGEKPHQCSFPGCGKNFSEKSSLKRHLLIHSGRKPFKCSAMGCGRAFADPTNARRHELTHQQVPSAYPMSQLAQIPFSESLSS